jgi:iron complex transport system substrate-binding protein
MKRNSLNILFCLLFISYACNESKQKNTTNSEKRIISLAPHITEIIYALDQDENLVGLTDFCSYPPEVNRKERIGGLLNPNIEKIVALKPTHLFGQPAHEKLNISLKSFGLSIIMMPNESIEDVITAINTIGVELGCDEKSRQLTRQILDSLTYREKGRKLLRAMLVIGKNAGELKNIMVAGEGTFLDEIWDRAGGQNIYRDIAGKYQTITLESIFARDPDVIIQFDPSASPGVHRGNYPGEWSALKRIKAFRMKNTYTIGGTYVLIPGPRMSHLARDMREIVKLSSVK